MPNTGWIQRVGVSALALVLFAAVGCASKQEKAIEQAKKQAISTGQPQQVVSVDKDGLTTTTVVQPPTAGQKEPTLVTTTALSTPKKSASAASSSPYNTWLPVVRREAATFRPYFFAPACRAASTCG